MSQDQPEEHRCPVCGEGVSSQDAVACGDCGTPHHPDCWEFTGYCSVFGCGSQQSLEIAKLLVPLHQKDVTIDERTRAPLNPRAYAQSLARKFKTRAKDLPATVTTGLAGAAFSVLSYLLIHPAQGESQKLYLAIFLTGLFYGLISPFLAPWQHRSPGKVAGVGLAAYVGVFLLGEWLNPVDIGGLLLIVPLFYSAILFASSSAEYLLGQRTWAAEKLGSGALPTRLGLTWVIAVATMLTTIYLDTGGIPDRVGIEVLLWGLVSVASGATALERGKEAYLSSLPSKNDPKALPEGS